MPSPSLVSFRSVLTVVLVPFALAAVGGAVLESTLRDAHACSCGSGDVWVLERKSAAGAQASWPSRGYLHGGSIVLEEPGSNVRVAYSP